MALDERKRYNIRLSPALASFFEERSKLTGQSVGACMALALMEYIEQKRGVEAMSGMLDAYRLEESKKAPQAAQKPAYQPKAESPVQKPAQEHKDDYGAILDTINRKHTSFTPAQETHRFD